jgi:hypothetical protein
MHRFRTALVSKSTAGGNSGSALWGKSALQGPPLMVRFSCFIDTFIGYVDAIDTSMRNMSIFSRFIDTLLEYVAENDIKKPSLEFDRSFDIGVPWTALVRA